MNDTTETPTQRDLIEDLIKQLKQRAKGTETETIIAVRDMLKVYDLRGERIARAEQDTAKMWSQINHVADAINGQWKQLYPGEPDLENPRDFAALTVRVKTISNDVRLWKSTTVAIQQGFNHTARQLRSARRHIAELIKDLEVETQSNLALQRFMEELPEKFTGEDSDSLKNIIKMGILEIWKGSMKAKGAK